MYELTQISIGDTVTIRAWDGSEAAGVVTGTYPDVKRGRPGVDFTDTDGGSRWAYLSQVSGLFPRGVSLVKAYV
jgi:hypothetical protein